MIFFFLFVLSDIQLSSSEKKQAAAKVKEPVSKLMRGIARVLKENIDDGGYIITVLICYILSLLVLHSHQ